jgi:hypothetical protein
MDRNDNAPESGLTQKPELVPLTEPQLQFAAIVGRLIAHRWRAKMEPGEHPAVKWPTRQLPRID